MVVKKWKFGKEESERDEKEEQAALSFLWINRGES